MTTTVEQVMAGINGWHRWNAWAAHFFVEGKQVCHTKHTYAEGGLARGLLPVSPKPVERSPFGALYGKVCARCCKLSASFVSTAPQKATRRSPR